MALDKGRLHWSLALVFLSMCEISGLRKGKNNDLSLTSILIVRGCMMESLNIGDIARMNHISYGTATKYVISLEKKGFVKREKGDVDGRTVYVVPTENAFRWVEEMEVRMREYIEAGTSRLSPDEQEQLIGLLARFVGYSDSQPLEELVVKALNAGHQERKRQAGRRSVRREIPEEEGSIT